MNFNWIFSDEADEKLQKSCVELEYQLRPKITRFLMSRLEHELNGDFSIFHFDVDMGTQRIWISDKTPEKYLRQIQRDFDIEINSPLNRSMAMVRDSSA